MVLTLLTPHRTGGLAAGTRFGRRTFSGVRYLIGNENRYSRFVMTHSPSPPPCAVVVDDDWLIRTDAAAILEEAGFTTMEASNADAALALLRDHHAGITLLFSDVHMPGLLDGFGLAREVATHWPHIAIVIASGRARPAPDELPDGARFVAKPFSAQVVRDHLRKVIPAERQPGPLRT